MFVESPYVSKLTARQQQILDLIQSVMKQTGAPPTRAEIAAQLGFKSANAAEEHLQALARKGAIELVSGTARGIRLRDKYLKPSAAKTLLNAVPSANDLSSGINNGISSISSGISSNTLTLPLIGRVAAGAPILAQEHIDQTYQLEAHLFAAPPSYLLKVRGMSMRDAGIFDGDLLAVQATREAQNGQIVVARLGDEVTVKRLMRLPHGIELHAENPDFPHIRVSPEDAFEIEGRAVGLIRKHF